MKTGPARFCHFIENRPVEFEIFKILRNFEIQNLKITILYFKNFDQNITQNFVVFHRRKIEASSVGIKIKKKIILIGFIATSYSVHRYVSTHLISSFPY
jgi:hypothetical protein